MKWIVWMAALCCLAPVARGEVMIPLSVETLAAESALVVYAKVESKTVLRDSAGRIYTRVELTPIETWKGEAPAGPLRVVHGGGALGEERVEVTAQVSFKPGREVVLFLVANERGDWLCLGMSQGQFHVGRMADGRRMVWNPFHGTAAEEGAAEVEGGLELERLRELVRRNRGKEKEK